tara:strand:- start:132 stop:422 length:291 start_codon:yes stop_codon:yes gene_type:complete
MNKYEHKYVNSVVAKEEPRFDWVVTKLHIKAAEFVDFLKAHKQDIETNNGFFSFDILKSSKDPSKYYARHTKINKEVQEPVTASQQLPDRQDDLPF